MRAAGIREGVLLSTSKGVERLVLIGLLDRANEAQLRAWPSVRWLARFANASERAVQTALKKLLAKGEIELVEPGGGRRKTNTYRISIFDRRAPNDDQNPADSSLVVARQNPAERTLNPADSSRNPAETAPERIERIERVEPDDRIDENSSAQNAPQINIDHLNEQMLKYLDSKWEPWMSKVLDLKVNETEACVILDGEYAAIRVAQDFEEPILSVLRERLPKLENVSFETEPDDNAKHTDTSKETGPGSGRSPPPQKF